MDSNLHELEMYEEDAKWFRRIMFVNGITSIIVNAFVAVLILTKTPTQMKTYRLFLLNIAVSFFKSILNRKNTKNTLA
jgi:hypothetical protein